MDSTDGIKLQFKTQDSYRGDSLVRFGGEKIMFHTYHWSPSYMSFEDCLDDLRPLAMVNRGSEGGVAWLVTAALYKSLECSPWLASAGGGRYDLT